MQKVSVELFSARDAESSFAIRLAGDKESAGWKFRKGFGSEFEKVWAVEFHTMDSPDLAAADWEAVLNRTVEAFQMSDPVIENFHWPVIVAERAIVAL
ncbi:MAG TPA: hypothetical protein VK633_03900 [Verrucomicrobiae bacterium]|nr:hypothetical protein [Verrucomicrobiae bacterium]